MHPEEDKSDGTERLNDVGQLSEIEVAQITANPRNPRQTFDPKTIERLAASIEDIGLQVPITVYHAPNNEKKYVLLDGERRFRACKLINKKSVPALVVQRPQSSDNAIRMFNIHMLREEWREIETAWALEQIIEEAGTDKNKELRQLTGLSIDRIQNMKRVLSYPRSYQEKVAHGEMPYQLLVELDKNVLSRHRNRGNDDAGEQLIKLTTTKLRDVFLQKYQGGPETDIVDLRKVGTLFETARKDGVVAARAKAALNELISNPEARIEDAFEEGAAASVEIRGVVRDLKSLPGRVEDLIDIGLLPDQKDELIDSLESMQRSLGKLLARVK